MGLSNKSLVEYLHCSSVLCLLKICSQLSLWLLLPSSTIQRRAVQRFTLKIFQGCLANLGRMIFRTFFVESRMCCPPCNTLGFFGTSPPCLFDTHGTFSHAI